MATANAIDCSVIIPAWNAEDFIGVAIESALAQQGIELEVLVIDDASTDRTAEVVAAMSDPRVTVIRRAENGGAAAARNVGFARAQGSWIAVLDADDHLLPGRLAALVALARTRDADIVADNLWVIDDGRQHLHIPEALDGSTEAVSLTVLYREAVMFAGGREYGYLKPLFSRAFLHAHHLSYDEGLPIGEDFQLLADALACGARFLRARSAGYIYSRLPGSLSHRLVDGQLEAIADADHAFLARRQDQLTLAEAQAVQARRRSAVTAAAFIRMITAIKTRSFGKLISLAARRPSALLLFRMPIGARWARLRAKASSTRRATGTDRPNATRPMEHS